MINEKENAVLLIAGFTQREISEHKQKFYNLFRIEPCLMPMRKKGEWQGLTKDEVNNWTLPDTPTVFAFCQFIEAKLKEKNT
jgi:hypothetical protein